MASERARTVRRPRRGDDPALDELEAALETVGSDRDRGARALSRVTLGALERAVERWRTAPPDDLARSVGTVARRLRRTQPAMGVFRAWAREWSELEGRTAPSRLRPALLRWLAARRRTLRQEPRRVARTVRRALPVRSRVVTISRSDSVRRSLASVAFARRPREVIVLESLPGAEGRLQAAAIRRDGLTARVVPDAQGRRLVSGADVLLVGADAVDPTGAVVHKVGTLPLARAAHRAGVPTIVVTGMSKSTPSVVRSSALGALFDRTPARYITEYWTDDGRIRGGAWPAWAGGRTRPRQGGRQGRTA